MRKFIAFALSTCLICTLAIVAILSMPSDASMLEFTTISNFNFIKRNTVKKASLDDDMLTHEKNTSNTVSASEVTNKKSNINNTTKKESAPDPYTTIVPEYGCTQVEYDTFCKLNQCRIKNGLAPVTWSKELYEAASIRSKELTLKLSHTRPDGSRCFTVCDAMRSENLAYGQTTASKVANSWIESSGHLANILDSNATTGAVSLYKTNSGYRYYWINVFG